MMNKKLVILCSGFARSGKDTAANNIKNFCESNQIRSRIYSFAWSLKNDLRNLLLDKFNIDSFTENNEEKNIIRPILISYGEAARKLTKGSYWWKKVQADINKDFISDSIDVAIISDGRFSEYENDELQFAKSYNENSDFSFKCDNLIIGITQLGILPAHQSEEDNIPKIFKSSDVIISWPHFGPENIKDSENYMKETYSKIIEKLSK